MRTTLLAGLILAALGGGAMAATPASRFTQDPYPSTYRAIPAAPVLLANATVLTGTGERLAGADVLLMMPTDWSEEIERERQAAYRDTKDQWFVSRFQTLLRFGRRWRTDANGQVTLPSEPWMWGIVHEDLWAHGHHFREPRIELLPRLRQPLRRALRA